MEINRSEFINQLVERHSYTKKSATALVDDFLDMLIENMECGNTVTFKGFGKFDIIERKQRACSNPKTGERCVVPAHLIPRFYPWANIRLAVKKYEAASQRGRG